jgi:hypothetical protein
MASPSESPPRRGIWLVRIGLPATIAVVGLVFLAAGSTGLGLTLMGVALVVAFASALVRLGIAGEADRYRDEEARRIFHQTGRWPDES